MLHPARLLTALVVLVTALVLRSAVHDAMSDSPEERPSLRVDVRHNQPLAEELSLRWRQLPGVIDAHAGYTSGQDHGTLTGYAVCLRCDLPALERRLVRDVWTSKLVRLREFTITVAHDADRHHPLVQTWHTVRDAHELYDRYGNGLVDPDRVDERAGSGSAS
ncbi:MAG TPA: hypothetical protein VFK34_04100 [Marmoricola sp.]|jgi:hypothetical protein|nr:hypothetical protein [Marmoricola sp.]